MPLELPLFPNGAAKKDRWVAQFISYLEVERSPSPRTVIAYRHALERFEHSETERSRACGNRIQFREFSGLHEEDMARSYVRLTSLLWRSFYRFFDGSAGLPANSAQRSQSLPN